MTGIQNYARVWKTRKENNMKIIGKRNDGFIVDIGEYELKQLTNYFYDNSTRFRIGAEIKVAPLFDQLKTLTRQPKEIKDMAHSLKTAAGILEKIDPVFYEEQD